MPSLICVGGIFITIQDTYEYNLCPGGRLFPIGDPDYIATGSQSEWWAG